MVTQECTRLGGNLLVSPLTVFSLSLPRNYRSLPLMTEIWKSARSLFCTRMHARFSYAYNVRGFFYARERKIRPSVHFARRSVTEEERRKEKGLLPSLEALRSFCARTHARLWSEILSLSSRQCMSWSCGKRNEEEREREREYTLHRHSSDFSEFFFTSDLKYF